MAINLVARMSFDDNVTTPMRRVARQMTDMERGSSRLTRQMERNNSAFGGLGRSAGGVVSVIGGLSRGIGNLGGGLVGVVSKLNPVALGFAGIATAAAGAYGAVKIFNSTVGEAMKMEQSEVIIGAMFNDKGASDAYMKMMDDMAIKSPIFNSQDMYGNSKMYVSRTKDVAQLEKMWKVTERLAAANPLQGTEGAVFSLNELLSGDTVSMVDRFGLDKNILAKIKKLSLKDQITEMDNYLERIGFTSELIEKMGNTSLGLWGQVKERSQTILRTMGEPSLKAVSKFMNEALMRLNGDDMNKYAEWGGKVVNSMVTGLSNNAVRLYDWFVNLTNDPEFQSKSTLTGKINFVVEDIASRLQAWYDGGGKDKIIKFGSDAAQVLVAAMDATDEVFVLGAKLGTSIYQGVMDGVKKAAIESPIAKALDRWSFSYTPQALIKDGINEIKSQPWYPKEKATPGGFRKLENSHSGGLSRVPYDGYNFTAHKDEMILTAEKAKEYRNGEGGNTFNFNVSLNGSGSTENDARSLMEEMARLIEREGVQMA